MTRGVRASRGGIAGDALVQYAEQHGGKIRFQEARRLLGAPVAGATLSRLVARGRMHRVKRGVYRIRPFAEVRLSDDVVRACVDVHGPIRTREVIQRTGIPRPTVQMALCRLVREGKLDRVSFGLYDRKQEAP